MAEQRTGPRANPPTSIGETRDAAEIRPSKPPMPNRGMPCSEMPSSK